MRSAGQTGAGAVSNFLNARRSLKTDIEIQLQDLG
jgi:hypothetical protein